jgi:(p)ppGpp synthase/HD superfamily hydrolase
MLEEAALLVRKYFAGKTRRGNGAPYEAHLLACQSFVASYKGRAPTQAAALLHDILEETLVSPAMLRDVVDDQVTSMVIKLTEDKALSWYERKARVVAMAKHCCQGVAIVLMADKTDNLLSFRREMKTESSYWRRFNVGLGDQIWFHQHLVDALHQNKRLGFPGEHSDLWTWSALEELTETFDRFRNGLYWTPDGLVPDEVPNSRPYLSIGG